MKPRKVAIVAVHGVAPHPRYEFQDQCALELCRHLNAADGEDTWIVDVVNPPGTLPPGSDEPLPTISRVHGAKDSPGSPKSDFFDVIEAYWSPVDKGYTNWFSVVTWLLRVVFVPLDTTARYHASWQKQIFDYGYIGGALVAAFALFAVSITATWQSLLRIVAVTGIFAGSNPGSVIASLDSNVSVPGGVPIKIGVWLFVGIVGAGLVSQALAGLFKVFAQRKALRANPGALGQRAITITVLAAAGVGLIYAMAIARFPHGRMGLWGVVFLLLVFVAFQLGYAILRGFLVDFFGDVQIYSTRDENSPYFGLRDKIIDAATDATLRVLSPKVGGALEYDRVIVLSHSLGTTIAMDAIIRLHQLKEQGAIAQSQFEKIRAFVTLGASLEKTRYFFDVAGGSPSMSYEQWRSDVYGSLFTDDPRAMASSDGEAGIFWANYWYFQYPICNKIESFRSFLKPGESVTDARSLREQRQSADMGLTGRRICRNEEGRKRMSLTHPLLHSDYIVDDWVWASAPDPRDHVGLMGIVRARAAKAAGGAP